MGARCSRVWPRWGTWKWLFSHRVSKLKLFPHVFLERVHYLDMIYAQNIMLPVTRLSRVFTHGLYSVFICSFFFFSFFIWVYDVFKASPLLGSDGFRPPCPAALGSSLRSTGICRHNQLKLSYRITDILLPKSIFPGWNGSLWKTSHVPNATAAFPPSLLYYFGTQVPEGSGVPGCPAMVLSLCPCFSNIDSLEPFILSAVSFQLKYDVYGVYSVFEGKEKLFFAYYCTPVTSLSFPAWFLHRVSLCKTFPCI